MDEFERLFSRRGEADFKAKYEARCHCGAIRYQASADPVDAKICHCGMCQKLHGAPIKAEECGWRRIPDCAAGYIFGAE